MLKKFLCSFVTLIVSFSFIIVPLVVSAEEEVIEDNLIELSNDDYKDYISDLLRPSFFSEFFNDMTASASDALITTKNYESTNAPKPSGSGSVVNLIKDIGKKIIEDVINDSVVDNSGCQIPEFHQQTGKLRNVYNSGLVEIITCTVTAYQTPVIGTLGEPTGTYNNHCILSFIRQIDDYYTITTICDNDSKKYCDAYSVIGTYKQASYAAYTTPYYVRFFDYATQETVPNHQIRAIANGYQMNWTDLETDEEIKNSTLQTYVYFGSYEKQGLPEFSSGSTYQSLSNILASSSVYPSSNNSARAGIGAVFAVSSTVTNDYQDYSQREEVNKTVEQKQAITYMSEINTTNVINKNNINNYKFLTIEGDKLTTNNNFDSWWSSSVEEVVNYNIQNTYVNYWYIGEPDPTEPPSTIPTQPSETYPPVILPTETYPLVTLPTETYHIPDLETLDTISLEISTLPDMQEFPEVAEVGGLVLQRSTSFLDSIGLLPVYITLGVLSIAVFIMRGQK